MAHKNAGDGWVASGDNSGNDLYCPVGSLVTGTCCGNHLCMVPNGNKYTYALKCKNLYDYAYVPNTQSLTNNVTRTWQTAVGSTLWILTDAFGAQLLQCRGMQSTNI